MERSSYEKKEESQFHFGSIQTDSSVIFLGSGGTSQFHFGSIQTGTPEGTSWSEMSLNSTLVQFKPSGCQPLLSVWILASQFHFGSIQTYVDLVIGGDTDLVGLNSTLVQFKLWIIDNLKPRFSPISLNSTLVQFKHFMKSRNVITTDTKSQFHFGSIQTGPQKVHRDPRWVCLNSTLVQFKQRWKKT